MGNYGNTMDRWYRRGAMVVWPRRLDFAVRAEASPSWALDTLAARLRDAEVARARELFDSAASFWMNVVRARVSMHDPASPQAHQPDLGQALAVAHGLDDATRAAILLRPFGLELLSSADVPALTGAADRYGEGWTSRVLDEWDAGRARSYPAVDHRRAWIASLPEFCDALTQSGGGIVAQLVLKSSSRWLTAALREAQSQTQPSRRTRDLDELTDAIAGLLIGTGVCDATELRDSAVALLCADDSLLHSVVNVLRRITDAAPRHRFRSGFEVLALHAGRRLEARLGQPSRTSDDWSIDVPDGCGCELCLKLGAFLADPAGQRLEWPLKEQSRRHVHSRIDLHELPVQHRTRRAGRPYTLVLIKLPMLFEREAQARREDQVDLRWIRERLNGIGQDT